MANEIAQPALDALAAELPAQEAGAQPRPKT